MARGGLFRLFGKQDRGAKPAKPKTARDPAPAWRKKGDWVSFDFAADPARAMPDWATLPDYAATNVAGTSYHEKACDRFFAKMDARGATARLEWETDRTPPGLRVIVHPRADAPGLHVGFVPADLAERLRTTYRADMPISARLRRAGFHEKDNAFFFEIVLVGPPKKRRSAFEI